MSTRTWDVEIEHLGWFAIYASTEDDAERQARQLVARIRPGAAWTLTEVKP